MVKDIESYYVFEDFDGCFYRNKIKSLLGENSFTNTPKEILEEFLPNTSILSNLYKSEIEAKCLNLWSPGGYNGQSMDVKEAGAHAYAEVLSKYGFKAYMGARAD